MAHPEHTAEEAGRRVEKALAGRHDQSRVAPLLVELRHGDLAESAPRADLGTQGGGTDPTGGES